MNNSRSTTIAVVVTLAGLLGAVLGATWAAGQPDRYSASTTMAVAPASTVADDADVIDIVGGLDRGTIVETLAGLVTSETVVTGAADQIAVPVEVRSEYDVDAVRVTSANLVDVSVSGPDPALVAELSNTVAQTAAASFGQLYRVYQVDLVTLAVAPDTSDRPSVLLVAAAGAVVAAIAAAIVVAAVGSRRRERHLSSVRAEHDQRLAS